jgi:hypothetical protein
MGLRAPFTEFIGGSHFEHMAANYRGRKEQPLHRMTALQRNLAVRAAQRDRHR